MSEGFVLPPGQQLVARGKWPLVGEREPRRSNEPWQVCIAGCVEEPLCLSLDALRNLPRTICEVDIHCVTRWTRPAVQFQGVLLADLLRLAHPAAQARFVSFVARSERDHSTSLPLAEAIELGTLVAMFVADESARTTDAAAADAARESPRFLPLDSSHGGPVRVIVPGRYFYKSLKWLERIELLETDRLGYWEATAGYHNTADPWLEQRYMAPALDRREVARLLASRDFSGRDLRSIDARGHDLEGLVARGALLRDADFRGCNLRHACFEGANLSNAHLGEADLRGATFQGADVEGADFSGADLRGADFRGASLFGASFCSQAPANSPTAALAARLDATTLVDPAALEHLTPLQAEYIGRFAT